MAGHNYFSETDMKLLLTVLVCATNSWGGILVTGPAPLTSHHVITMNEDHQSKAGKIRHVKPWKWTDAALVADASRFLSRTQWCRSSGSAYALALKRGLMGDCCHHMLPSKNAFLNMGCIYRFLFRDGSAYVGLSVNPERRRLDHLSSGPVHKKISSGVAYTFEVVESGLPYNRELGDAETKWLDICKKAGMTILNVNPTGRNFGAINITWTKEKIIQDSMRFSNLRDWRRFSPGGYNAFRRRGLSRIDLPTIQPLRKGMPGDKHPLRKLSSKEVQFIRGSSCKYTNAFLARKFSVSEATISNIVRGKSWEAKA